MYAAYILFFTALALNTSKYKYTFAFILKRIKRDVLLLDSLSGRKGNICVIMNVDRKPILNGVKNFVLWGVKSKKFPIVFKSAGKNQKKITEKREFLRKTSFQPNRFFYMVLIQKLITVNS
ncbi:Uncharacterized protein FWK35_00022438 [Aphis craccivora]|uniref:Uncharacterized protein n=1 Tax=Aphis craccivora TaxID=307492 RepID=A0A6G0Y3C5_APHCR|nr:Uncharacterized protein FWK35_00022438 [Aphis craccivora]